MSAEVTAFADAVTSIPELAGSVDLDDALRKAYPDAMRWDYVVGVTRSSESDRVIWIEVHPANSLSASDVIGKARWLRMWVRGPGDPLWRLTRERLDLVWIATGRVAIRRGSKQHRRLATAGVAFPVRHLNLP